MEIIAHFQFVTLKLLPVHTNAGDVNVKADQYPALPIYILKSCGWPQLRMALLKYCDQSAIFHADYLRFPKIINPNGLDKFR